MIPTLALLGTPGVESGQVFNLGPDEEVITILDLAQMLSSIIGFKLDPIFVPERLGETAEAYCSADKARRLLGYRTGRHYGGLAKLAASIESRGPRDFKYKIPLEVETVTTPRTWLNQEM